MSERMGSSAAAAYLGIKPSTWRSLVARKKAPAADGIDEGFNRAYWLRSTIDAWRKTRPGHGGRPRTKPS